jgi:hypothetical protein
MSTDCVHRNDEKRHLYIFDEKEQTTLSSVTWLLTVLFLIRTAHKITVYL